MPSHSDLQTLTKQRLDEARALLSLNFPDAAFYLAGYSTECALKAAVCKTLDQDDFYKPNRSNKATRYVQERIFREFNRTADADAQLQRSAGIVGAFG